MATAATPADAQEHALARIQEMDRRDEEQIISLLAGDLVHEYVYEFRDGAGRTQRGLSWAGIREYSQYRGNFRIEKPEVEDLGDAFRVMVQATDLDRNVTLWAGTHQPKSIRLRDGKGVIADDFAYEIAISKAQRNVIKNLMPGEYRRRLDNDWTHVVEVKGEVFRLPDKVFRQIERHRKSITTEASRVRGMERASYLRTQAEADQAAAEAERVRDLGRM